MVEISRTEPGSNPMAYHDFILPVHLNSNVSYNVVFCGYTA